MSPFDIKQPFMSLSYLCSSPNKLVTFPPASSTIIFIAALSWDLFDGNITASNSPQATKQSTYTTDPALRRSVPNSVNFGYNLVILNGASPQLIRLTKASLISLFLETFILSLFR